MTREEIIRAHIKRDGLGLEIGAGCSAIAPKKQGFRVNVLDHCDKEALVDLIRFLNDCDSLLKKAGILSLAVPNKRYSFDHFRPITGIGRVVDAAKNPSKFIQRGRQRGTRLELLQQVDREQSLA
jgi:hypothetical protein